MKECGLIRFSMIAWCFTLHINYYELFVRRRRFNFLILGSSNNLPFILNYCELLRRRRGFDFLHCSWALIQLLIWFGSCFMKLWLIHRTIKRRNKRKNSLILHHFLIFISWVKSKTEVAYAFVLLNAASFSHRTHFRKQA